MFGHEALMESPLGSFPGETATVTELELLVSSARLDLIYLVELYPYQPETAA